MYYCFITQYLVLEKIVPKPFMGPDNLHLNIRRFREQKGFSQSSMADELGIGRTTYINFETGKTRLYCKTLEKLARYFGVTEEEILRNGREDELLKETVESSENEKRIIIKEYETRLTSMAEKLEAARKVILSNERTIRTLSEINKFLLSQLRKND